MEIVHHPWLILLTFFNYFLQGHSVYYYHKILSEGMPAEQISTFNDSVASLAIDGQHLSNKSCSQTTEIMNPWWQVHLRGGLARVTTVEIRSSSEYENDLSAGIQVSVSRSTMQHNFLQCLSTNVTTAGEILVWECYNTIAARIVRIQLFDNTTSRQLNLCQVKVYGYWSEKYELLSDNMGASQSSFYLSNYPTEALLGGTCSCTKNDTNPWWQVYLEGGIARVSAVSIYFNVDELHRDQLNEIKVSASKLLIHPNFLKCASGLQSTIKDGQFISFECDADARIVRIQLVDATNTPRYLSLCHVGVYGYWIKKDVILSYDMPTSQTSVIYEGREAYISVTSEPNNYCSITERTINPWWLIYLEGGIARITVVSTGNYRWAVNHVSAGFKLLVSNSTKQKFSECGSAPEDLVEEIINVECNAEARIVQIQLFDNETRYLALCGVYIYGEWIEKDELMSYGMPASQSSTHSDFYATLAVDDNPLSEQFCSITTNSSSNPWWQVYLLELAHVSTVSFFYNILFHKDTNWNEFQVLVLNSTNPNFSECTPEYKNITNNKFIIRECYAEARIVRIQLLANTTRHLSLCDVKVYGHWIEKYELLSDGMPAIQSSTYLKFFALLAIDGNQIKEARKSCSVTQRNNDTWWQVHLEGSLALVSHVVIYNTKQSSRLSSSEFSVLVSSKITNPNFTVCVSGSINTTTTNNSNDQFLNLLECHAEARIIRIQLSGANKSLTLCDVKIYGQWLERDELLSQGMPASQSSNYEHYSASWAVDGDTNQYWPGNSCSCTKRESNPWWQVILLLGLARVTSVTIYPRDVGLPLDKLKIMLSNGTKQNFSTCATGPLYATKGEIMIFECNAVGRIVRIQLEYYKMNKYLTLCEVKAFGHWIIKDELLSQNMPARQSSTDDFASLAVDGNTNQSSAGRSCASTTVTDDAWWQVYLEGGIASVGIVSVYNGYHTSVYEIPQYNVLVSNNTKNNFTKCASSGPRNPNAGEIFHLECHSAARVVRIKAHNIKTKTYLYLCEVKVYGHWIVKDELLSKEMPTDQSSTFHDSSLAVDTTSMETCAITHSYPKSWWQVYLGEGLLARVINVFAYIRGSVRSELSGGKLLVSNSTAQNFSVCAYGPEDAGYGETIIFECDAVARIVRIERINDDTNLILCDVRVYGRLISNSTLEN